MAGCDISVGLRLHPFPVITPGAAVHFRKDIPREENPLFNLPNRLCLLLVYTLFYYELFLGIPVSIPLLHLQSVSKT